MLYVFGDSMSFGSKFYIDGMNEKESRTRAWPYLLSKRLNEDLIDFTYPGTSNWRMARKLQNLKLTPEDIVIIQWSNSYRFEMGVSDNFEYGKNRNVDISRLDGLLDSFEEENGYRTKAMCRSLLDHTSDNRCQDFMALTYQFFFNFKWFDEMFKIVMNSSCHVLDKSGCKYIMFDGWIPPCLETDFADVKQYVFRGRTIGNIVRGYPGNMLPDKSYPNETENKFVAELIERKYKEMYCNSNEKEEDYIKQLLEKHVANKN